MCESVTREQHPPLLHDPVTKHHRLIFCRLTYKSIRNVLQGFCEEIPQNLKKLFSSQSQASVQIVLHSQLVLQHLKPTVNSLMNPNHVMNSSHQSYVIGPDLHSDWLISLICNHYGPVRQLQQKEKVFCKFAAARKKKKWRRKINRVRIDACGALLSPYHPHTKPGRTQRLPHKGNHKRTIEGYHNTAPHTRASQVIQFKNIYM